MVGAALIVAGIALLDSLNPSTIGPALVLAVSTRPGRRVFEFAAAMFLVNFAAGVLLVLGPGHWLFSLIPSVSDHLKHVLYLVAGIALIAGAVVLVLLRKRLTEKASTPKTANVDPRRSGSAFLLGGGIALAELPTAFPYFAAIAAIAAADLSTASNITLVLLFNVLFLAPVIAIGIVVTIFPSLQRTLLEPIRRWLAAHWPQLAAALLALGGIALLVLGIHGVAND